MGNRTLNLLLDHATDVAGIIALTHLASSSEPVSDGIIGAIVTIAVGQRYAKGKWLDYQEQSADENS